MVPHHYAWLDELKHPRLHARLSQGLPHDLTFGEAL